MKNITQPLKIITLALALSVGISYVSAWTAPTVTPPNGNVATPLNVSGNDQSKLGSIAAASFSDSNDPANFFLNPNGDSKLKNIFTTGNVGIGTTNPERALHISSPGGMRVGLVTDPYSAVYDANGVRFNRNNESYVDQSTVGGWLSFRTSNASTIDTTAMTIKANGNIGVGTSVPTQKLDVVGDIKASGDVCNGTTCLSATGGGVPPGSLCGFSDWYGGGYWQNLTACQGVIPGYSGCPSGYTTINVAAAANHWMYSCVKN